MLGFTEGTVVWGDGEGNNVSLELDGEGVHFIEDGNNEPPKKFFLMWTELLDWLLMERKEK